jgi:hypothetical protein
MTAIRAEYCNFKNVMSRKVLQIILEVPIEQAPEVFRVLGMPANHDSKFVGVALLTDNTENLESSIGAG